jgi:hypothetical protein
MFSALTDLASHHARRVLIAAGVVFAIAAALGLPWAPVPLRRLYARAGLSEGPLGEPEHGLTGARA